VTTELYAIQSLHRRAALEEEQAKRRKALELELKKLRTEVSDAVKVFDDKVYEMATLRLQVHQVHTLNATATTSAIIDSIASASQLQPLTHAC
jgi:hypothetical protein